MGDEDSDWQGLKYQFTSSTSTSSALNLNAVSYTDSVKTTYACNDILDQAFFDSEFYGSIEFSQGNSGPTGAIVYIERYVLENEQTKDDGSYVRFEAGRVLNGVYYTALGESVNFSVTLESAFYSLVAFTGMTIATSITLLTF